MKATRIICLLLVLALGSGAQGLLTKARLLELCENLRRPFEDPIIANWTAKDETGINTSIRTYSKCVAEVEYMCHKQNDKYMYLESNFFGPSSVDKILDIVRLPDMAKKGLVDCSNSVRSS